MKPAAATKADRLRSAVVAVEHGMSQVAASRKYRVSQSSVSRLVRRRARFGNIGPVTVLTRGRPTTLSEPLEAAVVGMFYRAHQYGLPFRKKDVPIVARVVARHFGVKDKEQELGPSVHEAPQRRA